MTTIDSKLVDEFQNWEDPQSLIKELVTRFGDRCAIGTSGQLSGSVMIDMAFKAGVRPRVFTIDTLRLFPETYTLFDEIEKKYSFQIEKIQPDSKALDDMLKENGEFLFFDTKEKQELCCQIRKVDPNREVLKTLDVWITGLRADQSGFRAKTPRVQIMQETGTGRPILKVSPLLNWKEAKLRDYCSQNQVPTHALLDFKKNDWYYESLGCVICTTPISPFEPRRAGRWRWFNLQDPSSKECGLHTDSEESEKEID